MSGDAAAQRPGAWSRSLARIASTLAAAVLVAFGTSWIERRGPDHGIYCALGRVDGVDILCPEPIANGGWPAPYLFDTPGVSVERQLAFVEDDFRPGPFAADVAFYAMMLLILRGTPGRFRSSSRRKSG